MYALCNTLDKKEMTFQMETAMESLARVPGIYLVAIFDNGRKINDKKMQKQIRVSTRILNPDQFYYIAERYEQGKLS